MALLDQYGKEIRTNKPIRDEIAAPTIGGIRNIWSTYPSSGLTPSKLASILKEADQGIIYRQMELFEEMEEKDPHLFSVLQTRKRAVSNLPWEISPASDSQRDKDIAAAVKEQIKYIPKFKAALRDLLDAVGKGFAVSEITWGADGNEDYVEKLEWRHQKWFAFDQATGSQVRLLTDKEPLYGEELPPKKLIVPIIKAKSGLIARGGLIRVCAWPYLFKNYDIKDWVAFAEVFGMPLRIGKYPAGATEKDLKVLLQALTDLGQDAAAMIPEGMLIEFIEAQKNGSIDLYEKLARFCDAQMSKAVLGQTLTTEPGEKGGGSYALGQVHDEVRYDLIESDSEEISEVISEQLVRPLVDFNFGEQKIYPAFKLIAKKPEDLTALAGNVKTLTESGLKIPVAWAYEKFGIPEPQDDEEVLEPKNSGFGLQAKNHPPLRGRDEGHHCPICMGKASSGGPDEIDQLTTQLDAQANLDPWIDLVKRLAGEVNSLEELQEKLLDLYADMNPSDLGNLLQRALAVADLGGRSVS